MYLYSCARMKWYCLWVINAVDLDVQINVTDIVYSFMKVVILIDDLFIMNEYDGFIDDIDVFGWMLVVDI